MKEARVILFRQKPPERQDTRANGWVLCQTCIIFLPHSLHHLSFFSLASFLFYILCTNYFLSIPASYPFSYIVSLAPTVHHLFSSFPALSLFFPESSSSSTSSLFFLPISSLFLLPVSSLFLLPVSSLFLFPVSSLFLLPCIIIKKSQECAMGNYSVLTS